MLNMFSSQKFLVYSSLFLSIAIVMSSSSFLGIWMGMELNLFVILPILMMDESTNSEKAMMLYFMIQTISSLIMVATILSFSISPLFMFMKMLFYMCILIKAAMCPFHQWILSVVEGLSWNSSFIMLTLQKIIPLMSLMVLFDQNYMKYLITVCVVNSIISSISGLNTYSLRKIMTFSSINHLSFMMLSLMVSKKMFKIYFFMYLMMNFLAIKTFKKFNLSFLFQTFSIFSKTKIMMLSMIFIFLSMSGLPPFLGFMPKFMAILKLLETNMIFPIIIMILSNTVATFFYLRMCMPNLIMSMTKEKQKFESPSPTSLTIYLILFLPLPMLL